MNRWASRLSATYIEMLRGRRMKSASSAGSGAKRNATYRFEWMRNAVIDENGKIALGAGAQRRITSSGEMATIVLLL